MIKINAQVVVNQKSCSEIYDWLLNITPDKFRLWLPNSHLNTSNRSSELKVGETIWYELMLNGKKTRLVWQAIKLDKDRCISLKLKRIYPVYMRLTFAPVDNGTNVTYELMVGFVFYGFEKLFDWVASRFVITESRAEIIKQHERNKIKNLENII